MKDCQHCAQRYACDETPMAIGDLPAEEDMNGMMPAVRPSALVQLHVQPPLSPAALQTESCTGKCNEAQQSKK
jgi:hypothetical protein